MNPSQGHRSSYPCSEGAPAPHQVLIYGLTGHSPSIWMSDRHESAGRQRRAGCPSRGSPDHVVASNWLSGLITSGERFGVPWLAFITALRSQPQHIAVDAGIAHLDVLTKVCTDGQASGDLIPDAALAALAIEHGCEVVSFDRDFARFPGLRWSSP